MRKLWSPRNRTLAAGFVLALALALCACGTTGGLVPTGTGTGTEQTEQISVQDVLRAADREIKLAAVDVDDLCRQGVLSAPKCELAKQAVEAAAKAYNELLRKQETGLPVTVSACQAVLTTLRTKLAEALK